MHLRKEVDSHGNVWIHVKGMATQANIDRRDDPIVQALGENGFSNTVLVGLGEVVALDSSGVNWLLFTNKRIREAGGRMVLHTLSPIARNVFKVLNLHTVFEMADDESQARALVEENSE